MLREWGVRATQLVLGVDGLLHLLEVGSAVYEEAWTTAALTSIHTTIYFVGVYFIGHDHTHHREVE